MLVVVLGAGLTLSPGAYAHQATAPAVTISTRKKRGLFNGAIAPSSPSLRGISALRLSVAQGKRNAAKCRNQRRHKRHTKG